MGEDGVQLNSYLIYKGLKEADLISPWPQDKARINHHNPDGPS